MQPLVQVQIRARVHAEVEAVDGSLRVVAVVAEPEGQAMDQGTS